MQARIWILIAAFELYDLKQVIDPLCVCFLIYEENKQEKNSDSYCRIQ